VLVLEKHYSIAKWIVSDVCKITELQLSTSPRDGCTVSESTEAEFMNAQCH
jgi:hypothetical protein